jgi:hypothetical protein
MKAAIEEITNIREESTKGSGLTIDEKNILSQMWRKVELEEEFC